MSPAAQEELDEVLEKLQDRGTRWQKMWFLCEIPSGKLYNIAMENQHVDGFTSAIHGNFQQLCAIT